MFDAAVQEEEKVKKQKHEKMMMKNAFGWLSINSFFFAIFIHSVIFDLIFGCYKMLKSIIIIIGLIEEKSVSFSSTLIPSVVVVDHQIINSSDRFGPTFWQLLRRRFN